MNILAESTFMFKNDEHENNHHTGKVLVTIKVNGHLPVSLKYAVTSSEQKEESVHYSNIVNGVIDKIIKCADACKLKRESDNHHRFAKIIEKCCKDVWNNGKPLESVEKIQFFIGECGLLEYEIAE